MWKEKRREKRVQVESNSECLRRWSTSINWREKAVAVKGWVGLGIIAFHLDNLSI